MAEIGYLLESCKRNVKKRMSCHFKIVETLMRLQDRYGPIVVVLSIFAVVSKKMSFFVLYKEQQQTFDLVVIYSLEFL